MYDGHLVRREHFERVASVRATLNNQGHRADEGRGNLCTTKDTKSTKVAEHEAMDVSFQSSCSSCPSWLLELSWVINARSGECACQLYRLLRGGRRTRCPSYMGRMDVGLSRPAGRSRRPACTTDILSVAAGGGTRHRVAIAVWSPGRRLRLGGKRGSRVQALPSGPRFW